MDDADSTDLHGYRALTVDMPQEKLYSILPRTHLSLLGTFSSFGSIVTFAKRAT